MPEPVRILVAVAAACLALAAAGCGDEQPVRVAVLTECFGDLEAFEKSIVASAQLPFIERGAEPRSDDPADGLDGASVGGPPVEMLVGCTMQADLTRLIVEVRRLVEREGADVIIGSIGESAGVVVRRLAEHYPDVSFILGASGAQETTLKDPQPNLFRFVGDGAQGTAGLAAFAYHDLGWRRAALVMDPIPNSWESAAGFVSEFCALGGTVEPRAPLLARTVPRGAAADRRLGAQLARDVDGTMLISTVSNAAEFLRAYERPLGRLPQRLILKGFAFAQPGGLSPGGLDLSGVVLGGDVPTDSERPQWVRHREAYARAFPKLPPTWPPLELAPYMGAEALTRALERIDENVAPRGRRLQEALSDVAFEGPAGPVRLDRNRQAILAVHLRRIAGSGEQAVTEPFRIVPEVDQSFGGAFRARTPAPSFESPRCRRGPVPAWAAD